jgi:hypothetical protein
MNNLKWTPKDPDKAIGVPGKGYISPKDFDEEDLKNLIKRAKNRKQDVHSFLLGAGLIPVVPQFELGLEDPREYEKSQKVDEEEIEAHEQPRKRRTKAEIEADKGK